MNSKRKKLNIDLDSGESTWIIIYGPFCTIFALIWPMVLHFLSDFEHKSFDKTFKKALAIVNLFSNFLITFITNVS